MSFLKDYMIYTAGNEAHPTYHMYSALVALSSIVSRRVWIDLGYFQKFANLYVVLVGPPGNRKTTAMSICKALMKEIGEINYSAECQTKESLSVELQSYQTSFICKAVGPAPIQYAPITVCVTELSQFLGIASAHMIDFLTTIYDCNFYDLKTKNKGKQEITGPYLVLLGCTTPAWITSRLREDVISGGFSRRAIFVYETDKANRIAFPEVTQEAKDAWDRVVKYSRVIQNIGGPFKWASDAHRFYRDWYDTRTIPNDPTTQWYYETKHDQLLKISMLVALSERPELVLEKSHLEFSLEILALVEKNLPRVFEGLGRNELSAVATAIMDIVRLKPIPEKRLQYMMFKDASPDEFAKILYHLEKTDQIERVKGKGEDGVERIYVRFKTPPSPQSLPPVSLSSSGTVGQAGQS